MNSSSRVVCAAIRLKDGTLLRGKPFDGSWTPELTFNRPQDDVYSHGGIVQSHPRSQDQWEGMQPGFLLDDGTFCTRLAAYWRAVACNQVVHDTPNGRDLYSEDFWNWPLGKDAGRLTPTCTRSLREHLTVTVPVSQHEEFERSLSREWQSISRVPKNGCLVYQLYRELY